MESNTLLKSPRRTEGGSRKYVPRVWKKARQAEKQSGAYAQNARCLMPPVKRKRRNNDAAFSVKSIKAPREVSGTKEQAYAPRPRLWRELRRTKKTGSSKTGVKL